MFVTILMLDNCADQADIRGSTAHQLHLLDYKTDKLVYGPGYPWVFGPRFEGHKGKRALIFVACETGNASALRRLLYLQLYSEQGGYKDIVVLGQFCSEVITLEL